MSAVAKRPSAVEHYEHSIYGLRTQNHHCSLPTMAGFIRIASAKAPPVEEYDAWIAARASADPRGRQKIDGAQLRRAVLMRRSGSSVADVVERFGKIAAKLINQLPSELGA